MAIKGNKEFADNILNKMDSATSKGAELTQQLLDLAGAEGKVVDGSVKVSDKMDKQAKAFKAVTNALKKLNPLTKERLEKSLGGELDRKAIPNLTRLREEVEKLQKASRSQSNKDIFGKDIESITKMENALSRSSKKNKSNLDAQGKAVEALNGKVNELADSIEKMMDTVGKKKVLRITIENSGFQKVLDDLNRAMTNFYKRNGKDDNFFDPKAVRENLKGDGEDVKDAIKELGNTIGEGFDSSNLKKTITTKLAEIIQQGVADGVKNGSKLSGVSIAALLNDQREASEWGALAQQLKGAKLTPKTIEGIMTNAMKYHGMGSDDLLAMARAEINADKQKEALARKEAMKKIASSTQVKTHQIDANVRDKQNERLAYSDRMMRMVSPFGDIQREIAEAYVERVRLENINIQSTGNWDDIIKSKEADLKELSKQHMILKNDKLKAEAENERAWSSRKEAVKADAQATDLAMEQQMLELQGRELTGMDEALMKMTRLLATRKEIEDKAEDGVRMTSAQVKNWQDLEKQVRVIAKEQLKIENGYDDQNKALEKSLKLTQSYDQKLQAIGNMLSGMVRLWDKIGSGVQSIFGRFRNNIVNMFAQGRSEVRNLVTEATEQYSKLERAQIGFSNFFGADSAKKLVSQIQKEAIAAPALSSGDLADYVAQLAPVSGGNADLALNATMGVLKAIQYSGSSASTEMWRVVTNIRDVMSKGMATTIDIRQFNKAMPAIEKALGEIGASEFLSNGQLKITKENAKQIVEMFARLNTDDSSPVKNIFKQMGNTMGALQEAFQERKTQAMVNVLKNSGAFDMAKGVLSDASNSGLIAKAESFFTEKLKKIVDYIRSVDWDKVGSTFKDGLEKIKEGVITAYNTVKQAMPDVNGWGVIETIFTTIRNAIVGFGDGLKTVITIAKNITSNFSPEIIEKAASAVGFLLSPAQKLFSYIGTLATTVTSIAQNLNKTMSKFTQTRIENYNKYIDKAAESMANAMTSQKDMMGYFKQFDNLVYNQKNGTVTGYKKVQVKDPTAAGGFRTETKVTPNLMVTPQGLVNASEYKSMSLKQRADTYYGGSRIKAVGADVSNFAQRSLNSFAAQLNKIVVGGQILALGTAAQATMEKTNKLGQALTAAVQGIGIFTMALGAGKAIGGMFGSTGIGGTVGGILGAAVSIYGVVKAWYDADRAQKAEEAKNKREEAMNDYTRTLRGKIMESLGLNKDETASGAYVYEWLTKTFGNEKLQDLIGQGEYGNLEQTVEHFAEMAKGEYNRYQRSDLLEKIDDFVSNDSEELSEDAKRFHAQTGTVYSNWGDDASAEEKETRAWLAQMIREHGLLSAGSFGKGSLDDVNEQTLVESFLEDMDGTINSGQIKMLKEEVDKANAEFPSNMQTISEDLKGNTSAQETLKGAIADLNTSIQTIIDEGVKVVENGSEIEEQNSLPSDRAVSKSTDVGWFGPNGAVFGDISKGYNEAKGKLFDDGTLGALKNTKLLEGGESYDLFTKLLNPAIRNSAAFSGKYREDNLIDMLYQMLNTKTDEANGDTEKLTLIGQAYDRLERESLIGLPREEMIQKMLQIVEDLYAMSSWLFNAKGGLITAMMKAPIYRATGGRGVDTVPAFLQPGEFVMRRGSVMKAGLGVMSALNRGDLAAAARGLGARLITGGANNSRSWNNTVNNNQRTNNNVFNIVNRNLSARTSTYSNLANRIATI